MVMREFNDFIFGMEWMCTLTRSVLFYKVGMAEDSFKGPSISVVMTEVG